MKIFACVTSGGAISDEPRIKELLEDAKNLLQTCDGLMCEIDKNDYKFKGEEFKYFSREGVVVAQTLSKSFYQWKELKNIINMIEYQYKLRPISRDNMVKHLQDVKGQLEGLKRVLEHLNSVFQPYLLRSNKLAQDSKLRMAMLTMLQGRRGDSFFGNMPVGILKSIGTFAIGPSVWSPSEVDDLVEEVFTVRPPV